MMSQSRRVRNEEKRTGVPKPEAAKQSKDRLKLSPGAEKLLSLFFLAATIAGLILSLWLALVYPLTSDMANAGLFPMEVMRGNFEYVLPANNPYLFTDYLFHLVVQPLTGYSPEALVLTGYAIYVLIVLACALIVLRLAGRMEALAAAALVANLPFMGLRYVLYPLYHNGTILFILLSLLVFYADRPPFRLSLRWRVLIIALLQFLGVFSDTLMLPLFTLPLLVYSGYVLLKQRLRKGAETGSTGIESAPVLWIASAVPALIIYALKSRLGQLWPGGPILAASAADLGSPGNLLKYPYMLSYYFDGLIQNSGSLLVACVILVLVAAVFLDRKDRFLHAVLVLGGLLMLAGFMSMTIAGDPARYLTPITIVSLVVAATWTMRRGLGYLPLVAITAVILISLVSNALVVNENIQPDYVQNQRALVTLLERENITHAYADYWDANVNTYLSRGKVTVEPVYVEDDRLRFQTMNSAPRWANTWPDGNDPEPVVIVTAESSLDDWTRQINKNHAPLKTYEWANGWIYVYNGTLPAWPPKN